MFPGCFSWCGLRMPWGAKKKSTEMELPEVSAGERPFILRNPIITHLHPELKKQSCGRPSNNAC